MEAEKFKCPSKWWEKQNNAIKQLLRHRTSHAEITEINNHVFDIVDLGSTVHSSNNKPWKKAHNFFMFQMLFWFKIQKYIYRK